MSEVIKIIEEINEQIQDEQLSVSGECMTPYLVKTDGMGTAVSLFGIHIWGSDDGFEDIHSDEGEEFTRENLTRQSIITSSHLSNSLNRLSLYYLNARTDTKR